MIGTSRRTFATAVCAAVLCVWSAGRAQAAPIVIDQQNLGLTGALGGSYVAQTFTVGLAGRLTGVDMLYFTNNPGTLYITGTTAGVPDITKTLASVAVPIIAPLGATTFIPMLSFAPVPATVGQMLAIVMEIPNGSQNWSSGGPYVGGAIYTAPRTSPFSFRPFTAFGANDLSFRTYVDTGAITVSGGGTPPPVPEPSTWLLLGTGIAMVPWLHRRRTRQGNDIDTAIDGESRPF